MTALTPTQAKTAKPGKSRRVLKRPAKKLSIPDDDEDTEDGFDEKRKDADDGDQDSPSDEQEETAASRPGPVTEREPVPAQNEETAEEAPTQVAAQATQASDEQGERRDGSDAPAPTMDIAVIANALQQLTTAVAGLQAREAARSDGDGHGRDASARGGGQQRVEVDAQQQPAVSVTTGASQRGRARGAATDDTSATRATSARTVTAASVARVPGPAMEAAPVGAQPTSPEIAAMAAAVQQLTTMMAQNPSTATSGGTRSQARTDPRSRTRGASASTRATRMPPDDDEPSESSSSSDDSDDSDDSDAGNSDDGSDSNEDDGDSDGDSSGDSDDDGSSRRRQHGRHGRRGRRGRHGRRERQQRRKSVKDLELPTYTPSPKLSVSTWIDRVDLALQGAKESGRGKWSGKALYYILGNKLMEDAARWWVNMNRRLPERQRTWKNLKKALLRRYGERKDKSAAEWRVGMRPMMPGETYADFAAGLRDVVGINNVRERVLLAQFYRCLDKTTRKLVKQAPRPKTLEEAVDKATEIDDPVDNVAQGMMNIGLPWATAPQPYLIPMVGTSGQTIPGIGGMGLPAEMLGNANATEGVMARKEMEHVALFTNPQGVYNKATGTWDPPPGHVWNGKYWYEPRRAERKRSTAAVATSSRSSGKKKAKVKVRREEVESSSDESDAKPKKKKLKAAVKQAGSDKRRVEAGAMEQKRVGGKLSAESSGSGACFHCGQSGHWAMQCPTNQPKCYACNRVGHYARTCTDPEAKARNDAYMQTRERKEQPAAAENE